MVRTRGGTKCEMKLFTELTWNKVGNKTFHRANTVMNRGGIKCRGRIKLAMKLFTDLTWLALEVGQSVE